MAERKKEDIMYEPQDTEKLAPGAGNGKFLIGLLTGAALGAAVGLILAPRSGSELRQQLSSTTERWRQKAAETYEQASGTVNDMMSKGRQVAERSREAFQSARQNVEPNFPSSTGTGSAGL